MHTVEPGEGEEGRSGRTRREAHTFPDEGGELMTLPTDEHGTEHGCHNKPCLATFHAAASHRRGQDHGERGHNSTNELTEVKGMSRSVGNTSAPPWRVLYSR